MEALACREVWTDDRLRGMFAVRGLVVFHARAVENLFANFVALFTTELSIFHGFLNRHFGHSIFFFPKTYCRLYRLACPQAYSFGPKRHRAGRVGYIRKDVMLFNDHCVCETGSVHGV